MTPGVCDALDNAPFFESANCSICPLVAISYSPYRYLDKWRRHWHCPFEDFEDFELS